MLSEAIEWLRHVVLLKWPYSSEFYLFSLVTSACVKARGKSTKFEGMLLPMFVHTLMCTTGSGVVGPLLMRDPPLFLNNDLLVTCIMAFFLFSVVFDPYVVNFIKTPHLWKAMALLSTTSRMNKICFIVDYALTKFPPSPYYPIALFGPIMIGLARGIGGSLVPADKGLSSISKDLPWTVQLCFSVATFYHIVANDTYILGGMVRGALGLENATREDIRLIAVTFGVVVTVIQTYYAPKFNPFTPAHQASMLALALYTVTGMPKTAITIEVPRSTSSTDADKAKDNGGNGAEETKDKEKKEGEGGGLYDLKTRKKIQSFLEALKPVGVAAVAVLALYSRQPPSTIIPGVVVKAGGSGLASCAFLPKVLSNGCTPLRAAVTETGSLVVYRGKEVPVLPAAKKKVEGEDGAEVLWSSPAPKKLAAEDEVQLDLSEDGILSVMAGDKKLWSSTLTTLGKRLPNFRVEARLDAVKGALEVYKGGQLQWSSAGGK
ncbi:unnamed protein product [Ectocarpus sp. 6 AP-2014]